jgi:tRNA threonylcarbamoyladenosine biosynthesis protein TsaB
MILLIADTSGRNGSVAIARAAAPSDDVEVIESATLAGGMFSAQLVPQIATLLSRHGLNKNQIDGFIVVSGPGSFTGLRVGLAAIKALAEILAKPIVPISLLEVVALAANSQGKVLAALNAGRGEFYAGEYEISGDTSRTIRESLLPKDELLAAASGSLVSTTDSELAGAVRAAGLSAFLIECITPAMVARHGLRQMEDGATVSSEQLEANYGRRSDAEIFVKPHS